MKNANELGMIVAFYLSKFGTDGLARLGFQTYKQAFEAVGSSLQVSPNSVKNWRDEFDPYYDNGRMGWHQREMRPSRLKVIEAFDDLGEEALCSVVLDIIKPEGRQKIQTELSSALNEIKRTDEDKKLTREEYVARGPTGRMAEEFFVSRFNAGLTQFKGDLRDRRDDGVGYDFEIAFDNLQLLIEIKGSAKELSSISFTDKEWRVAKRKQDDYFLGLVIEVQTSPKISFVQNPASTFVPIYRAFTTVAVSWTVNSEQLQKIGSA